MVLGVLRTRHPHMTPPSSPPPSIPSTPSSQAHSILPSTPPSLPPSLPTVLSWRPPAPARYSVSPSRLLSLLPSPRPPRSLSPCHSHPPFFPPFPPPCVSPPSTWTAAWSACRACPFLPCVLPPFLSPFPPPSFPLLPDFRFAPYVFVVIGRVTLNSGVGLFSLLSFPPFLAPSLPPACPRAPA